MVAIARIDVGSGAVLCFGGPYSNLQATQAMRDKAERLAIPPARVICTGDIVAYCADPNPTTEAIRDWGCHVIQGNCEEQLVARAADCGCGFGAGSACDMLSRGWYPAADRMLRDDLRAWMGTLPRRLEFDFGGWRVATIHGGSSDISRFIYPGTPAAAKASEIDALGADVVIAGHCGLPFVERHGQRLWLNAGVIGMPANDATPDGWYAVMRLDGDGVLRASLHRLHYDWPTAAAALEQAGFAPDYARALRSGLWPSLDVLPDSDRAATGRPIAEQRLALSPARVARTAPVNSPLST